MECIESYKKHNIDLTIMGKGGGPLKINRKKKENNINNYDYSHYA